MGIARTLEPLVKSDGVTLTMVGKAKGYSFFVPLACVLATTDTTAEPCFAARPVAFASAFSSIFMATDPTA